MNSVVKWFIVGDCNNDVRNEFNSPLKNSPLSDKEFLNLWSSNTFEQSENGQVFDSSYSQEVYNNLDALALIDPSYHVKPFSPSTANINNQMTRKPSGNYGQQSQEERANNNMNNIIQTSPSSNDPSNIIDNDSVALMNCPHADRCNILFSILTKVKFSS